MLKENVFWLFLGIQVTSVGACEGPIFSQLPSPAPTVPEQSGVADLGRDGTSFCGQVGAQAEFTRAVLPPLSDQCGPCHNKDGGIGPAFMPAANPYQGLLAWPRFFSKDPGWLPEQSLLLTKGMHEGPTPSADLRAAILCWLGLELQPVPGISFREINADLDQPALGCSSPTMACHGGGTSKGMMHLQQNGLTDSAALLANYQVVSQQIDLLDPPKSPLLTKPLTTSGIIHTGGKVFMTNADPIYLRWLSWIRSGAPF